MAIVWATKRLHIYLMADTSPFFTVCRTVQLIFDNVKLKQPASIEWWNIRLQGYDFSVTHTQGVQNPSDFLSRHAYQNEVETHEKMTEDYNFLVTRAVHKAMSYEIKQATKDEETYISWR